MATRHPARQRLLSYLRLSLLGASLFFISLTVITGFVVATAWQLGPAETAYVLFANATIATFVSQFHLWNTETGGDDDSDGSDQSNWLFILGMVVLTLIYINALVFVSLAVGMAAPADFALGAVLLYTVYDMLVPHYGVPLSVTGIFALTLGVGLLIFHVVDEFAWQDFVPSVLLARAFGRRPGPRAR